MIHEPTDEVANAHPVTMSESPYNSYYLKHCAIVERPPAYASCLAKINSIEAGRISDLSPECTAAIESGRCEALGMREQEKLKGIALFYYPSTFFRNMKINNLTPQEDLPRAGTGPAKIPFVSSDPRAANFAGRYREYVPPRPAKGEQPALAPVRAAPMPSFLESDDGGYAAAINAAMKEVVAAPTPAPKPAPVPKPVPTPAPKPVTAPPEPPKAPSARPTMLPGETPLQYARRVAASR